MGVTTGGKKKTGMGGGGKERFWGYVEEEKSCLGPWVWLLFGNKRPVLQAGTEGKTEGEPEKGPGQSKGLR